MVIILGYDHVSPRMDSATALTERHELTDSTGYVYFIVNPKSCELCIIYCQLQPLLLAF